MRDRLTALIRLVRRRLNGWAQATPWGQTIHDLIVMPLVAVLTVLLTLIILFEEWGWQPLVRLFGLLARWRPVAMLEAGLARLPPYGALAAFLLPVLVLLPFKLLALYLLAHGSPFSAALVFIAAKLVGTGLVGRIYLITKPQLMRIGWFSSAYGMFMPWKERLFEHVRASWAWRWGRIVKALVHRRIHQLRQRLSI